MPMRLTLCGFSDFESKAMRFSFEHTPIGTAGHQIVGTLAEAHFIVVDAGSPSAVNDVRLAGRAGDAVFVGGDAPEDAAAHLPRPINPIRILRALGQLTPRVILPAPSAQGDAAAAPAELTTAMAPSESDPDAPQLRLAAKTAARAAVRRAQLTERGDANLDAVAPAVLVLDSDPESARGLVDLLTRFGFAVTAFGDIVDAHAALHADCFAAVFLDIALDGADQGEGLALLRTVHALPLAAGREVPAVVLLRAQLEPADRVRASLAGVGMPLLKPVGRGDLVRALESRGVVLPADARRI